MVATCFVCLESILLPFNYSSWFSFKEIVSFLISVHMGFFLSLFTCPRAPGVTNQYSASL